MNKVLTAAILPFILVFGACSVETGEPDPGTGSQQDELLTRTIVELQEDGTEKITVQYATQAELDEELRLHKELVASGGKISQAITQDTSCAGSSLWMHDQVNQSGNRICYYGSGQADFGSICRVKWGSICLATWSGAVRSLWSGADYGALDVNWIPAICGQECSSFGTYERRDSVSACEQGSSAVVLHGACTPT